MSRGGLPKTVGVLQNLLVTCRVGEYWFRAAAEGVEDPTLKRLFLTYSEQRAGFARELRQELASVGGEGTEPREGVGERHTGPLGGPGVLEVTEEAAIIAEREQGEQDALDAYGSAVRRRLPGSVGKTVERQYVQVKEAHKHVRSLERSVAGKA
jgi:uncharacterized protein (TIGR02284 family)